MEEIDFNSSYILNWLERLEKDIADLPFEKDKRDIRIDFFELVSGVGFCYYKASLLPEIVGHFESKACVFQDQETLNRFSPHITFLRGLDIDSKQKGMYFNFLNRGLLIDSWSLFELALTTICLHIPTEAEREKILNRDSNEILKYLKNDHISEKSQTKIKKKLVEEFLPIIPTAQKINFLLAHKVKNYPRDKKEDRKFLEFYGRFRNTMHSNYIFFGKNPEVDFQFKGVQFFFRNGLVTGWEGPGIHNSKFYFDIVEELLAIFKAIITSIEFDRVIPYPDPIHNP